MEKIPKDTKLTLKFNGESMYTAAEPIRLINEATVLVNQPKLIPAIFGQFGSKISAISVYFAGSLFPASTVMQAIVNNTALHCTESMTFELINWWPCDAENVASLEMVVNLSIYDAEFSATLMDQIGQMFPNVQRLKFIRCNFMNTKDVNVSKTKMLDHLKHLEIHCQLKQKCRTTPIVVMLKAYSKKLNHLTLTLDKNAMFWKSIGKHLKNCPSLELGYISTEAAQHIGVDIRFDVKKLCLFIPAMNEQVTLKFGQSLQECTLRGYVDEKAATVWTDFIISHQSLERVRLECAYWFGEKNLIKILENLSKLTELTMVGCRMSRSDIAKILYISPTLKKLHLIHCTQAVKDNIEFIDWRAVSDYQINSVLFEKY